MRAERKYAEAAKLVEAKVMSKLKRYRAIAIDIGDQDGLRVDSAKLHDVLQLCAYGLLLPQDD